MWYDVINYVGFIHVKRRPALIKTDRIHPTWGGVRLIYRLESMSR